MMEKDPKIVAISAAMLEGTGLIEVKKRFPDRVFDVGHRRGARGHLRRRAWPRTAGSPSCRSTRRFLQRSFDQLIHDVALQSCR